MRELTKQLLFNTAGILGNIDLIKRQLIKLSQVKVHVPFYHAINEVTPDHLKNLISVKSPAQFRKDLRFFQKYYNFISLEELLSFINNDTALPENPMIITFDDGLQEVYKYAALILEEFHAPAIFFLNPDFLDNQSLFYRHKQSLVFEYLHREKNQKKCFAVANILELPAETKPCSSCPICSKMMRCTHFEDATLDEIAKEINLDFEEYLNAVQPYLSSTQVSELIDRGFYVGGHSINHPDFKLLNLEDQIQQTTHSVELVTDKFNVPYRVFSSPFHNDHLSTDYFDSILNDNIDVSFGIDGTFAEEIHQSIQRFNMESEGNYSASQLFSTYYFVKLIRRALGKETLNRQSLN